MPPRRLIELENQSGYDTDDLIRIVEKAARVMGVRKRVYVIVTASPIRSRGCATVGGDEFSLAVAPPSKFTMRRFARLNEHEWAHIRGLQHEQMGERLLYSEGPLPRWAEGLRLRYRGRAPDQMNVLLRHGALRCTGSCPE